MDYKQSGVDIDAGNEVVRRIRSLARGTFTSGVLSEIGSFGGLFRLEDGAVDDPVLVASADGVGTKLRVAFMSGVHRTIGVDLVNHCVNDILVQGARPLFFLDYLATGALSPDVMARIVEGVATGCKENGCALLGGETAEMPGFYGAGEYDVAGFIVGIVDKPKALTGSGIKPGDILVGLPSAGLHTNGYSLARKIFFEVAGKGVNDSAEGLSGTIGEALLAEHRSYLPQLRGALDRGMLRGLAHITGGGLTDNVPRILPEGTAARIARGSWPVPPVFTAMQRLGGVEDGEMLRTFNMGIGMVCVVAPDLVPALEAHLDAVGERHFVIGAIVPGERNVVYA